MEIDCVSVAEFCLRVGIGRTTFYELLKAGIGPDTVKVGHQRMITVEAAEKWLMERASLTLVDDYLAAAMRGVSPDAPEGAIAQYARTLREALTGARSTVH